MQHPPFFKEKIKLLMIENFIVKICSSFSRSTMEGLDKNTFKIITIVEYSLGKKRNKINTVDLKQ